MNFMMDTSGYDVRRWVFPTGYVYDRPTDWDAAKSIGITCAAVKSSEALYEDPGFKIQWAAAKGRPRVAWHFFRANVDAIAQAKVFLGIIGRDWVPNMDLACIDWETRDGQDNLTILRAGMSFLYEVEKVLGIPAAIYTYPGYWNGINGGGMLAAKRNPLFLAQWPLDNWVLNFRLPPSAFYRADILDQMQRIQNKTLRPMALSPWGYDIMDWQWTARAWTKDIPGHAAIKTLADLNAIMKPWWVGNIPSEPLPVPIPVTLTGTVIYERINVRARPDSTSAWVRFAVRGETMNLMDVNGSPVLINGYVQLTDGNWVYRGYIKLA